jgi:TRIAD3 protein (E3 ubiquitin-protein ligase RNF216)
MSTDGCTAGFARQQFQRFLDEGVFARLELLQQNEDIKKAGIENLDECPFCDFKAECLPVEIDREFRCLNSECEKVSCRLCQAETHIPQTCEEFAKDNKLSVRHIVEEAMTNALKRNCK